MDGKLIREDGQILYEMSQIGKFDSFEIWIYGGEGPVPHFHLITGNQKSPEFETCIKIKEAEYFHHSGKEGALNSKEKKRLIEFLQKPHHKLSGTNWEILVAQWGMNNPKYDIPFIEVPNYREL